MATVLQELVVKVRGDMSQLESEMGRARGSGAKLQRVLTGAFSRVQGTVDRLRRSLFSLRGVLLGLGIGALAKSFITAADQVEQYNLRLVQVIGSQKEANALFEDMREVAKNVAFEFEDIMDATTNLAAATQGSVKDVKQFMPIILDLAATFGLSVQDVTSQIIRMFSAGANAADLFRQRGVLEALGFQAGVSISASATRKQLIAAFEDPESIFRGTAAKLSKTWTGLMSMLSDSWFEFRNVVMDAGIFNSLKAMASVLDKDMREAVEGVEKGMKDWGETTIVVVEVIAKGLGRIVQVFKAVGLALDVFDVVQKKVAATKFPIELSETGKKIAEFFGAEIVEKSAEQLKIELRESQVAALDLEIALSQIVKDFANFDDFMPGITDFFERSRQQLRKMADEAKEVQDRVSTIAPLEPVGGPGEDIGGIQAQAAEIETALAAELFQAKKEARNDFIIDELELIREGILNERDLMIEQHEDRLDFLQEAHDAEFIQQEEFDKLREELELKHQAAMGNIEAKGILARRKFEEKNLQQKTQTVIGMLTQATQGVAASNKTMFEINKVAAIANAVINTAVAVTNALAIPPPPLGIALAAVMAAAGLAEISAIRGTTFGGGGGSVPGIPSLATTVNPVTPIAGAGQGLDTETPPAATNVTINLGDDDQLISTSAVRELLEQLNDAAQDTGGGGIVITVT